VWMDLFKVGKKKDILYIILCIFVYIYIYIRSLTRCCLILGTDGQKSGADEPSPKSDGKPI